jgi:hypothetical protein
MNNFIKVPTKKGFSIVNLEKITYFTQDSGTVLIGLPDNEIYVRTTATLEEIEQFLIATGRVKPESWEIKPQTTNHIISQK